jgi:hypothetical protein
VPAVACLIASTLLGTVASVVTISLAIIMVERLA